MAQALDLFVNLGHLVPIGHQSLNADDLTAKHQPGTITIIHDSFGMRMFKYMRTQQSGGQSKGELVSRVANVTGTVTAVSGETNDTAHLSDTSNFTADDEVSKLCIITDNADSAGAAPEGEVAIVTANTVTQLTFDPNYKLSTAPAVSDTYSNLSISLHDDSADGDLAINVFGLLMQDRTADYYGWIQFYGYNPGALYTTAAVTPANDPVVADAAALLDFGSDTEELWVGYAPLAIAGDLADPFRSLVFIDLLHQAQSIA